MEVVEGDEVQVVAELLFVLEIDVIDDTLFLFPMEGSLVLGGLDVSRSSSRELRLSSERSASLKTSRRPVPLSS